MHGCGSVRDRRPRPRRGPTAEGRNRHGDHVEGTPTSIEARPDVLPTIYETYIQPDAGDTETDRADHATAATAGTAVHGANNLDNADLIARAQAAANDEKSEYLWRGGTSSHERHSESDLTPQPSENDRACGFDRNTSTVRMLDSEISTVLFYHPRVRIPRREPFEYPKSMLSEFYCIKNNRYIPANTRL